MGHQRLLAVALAAAGFAASARAASAAVVVFPEPGSRLATPQTQITLRGVSASEIGSVTVMGSRSGAHSGHIAADSDGQGGSFLPDSPFVPGEVVTVRTNLGISGARNGTFAFTVEQALGDIPPPGKRTTAPRLAADVNTFRSRPDLQPPAVKINQGQTGGGDLFLTPMRGPVQWGPMIVDPAGKLVWFQPLVGDKREAADLRVQSYNGQPVLTWWQGYQNAGVGVGEDIIYDQHYHQVATVAAGNGLRADLHEFTITPQGTALITAYRIVVWDASAVGASKRTAVMDSVVQEIDIPTGLVLFQWDSLDHVPLGDSYVRVPPPKYPDDYFHVNSVQEVDDGSLIVSARNTWAVYDIDHGTGNVIWRLGGKHSDFKLGPGTSLAFQHHVRSQSGGLFTVFDDGAAPQVHSHSRGLVERVDVATRTVTLVRELDHSPQLVSSYEGSVQLLANGDEFVGWGALPYFTEFAANGRQIYDGRFVDENSSYRAYRFAWSGQPDTQPSISAWPDGGGVAHLDASWNGATEVTGWRVLAGPSPTALSPVTVARRAGFETDIPIPSGEPYFQVQALAGKATLGISPVTAIAPHIAAVGRSAFVSGGWVGGIPISCDLGKACGVTATIQVGRAVIGKSSQVSMPAGGNAIAYFTLTGAGHAMLVRARARRLPVRVVARDASGVTATTTINLIAFSSHGHVPPRAVSQSPTVQFLGLTDFVFDDRTGGILAACTIDAGCRVSITVSAGTTTIARTRPEFIGARQLAYLAFSLTPAGKTMLAHARGNRLPVKVTLTNGGDTATGQIALVGFR
jgi:Arylsulfotransferase (ASST)